MQFFVTSVIAEWQLLCIKKSHVTDCDAWSASMNSFQNIIVRTYLGLGLEGRTHVLYWCYTSFLFMNFKDFKPCVLKFITPSKHSPSSHYEV